MNYKSSISVKPEKNRLINLLEEIRRGKIVVPKFQRDYVWNSKQRLELFDSISKGFPIGSLLFWAPRESEYGYNNTIGPYILQIDSDNYSYIIDGYQRITTLFSALTNPNEYRVSGEELLADYIIYYDLENEEFTHRNKVIEYNSDSDFSVIPLYILVNTFEFLTFTKRIIDQFNEETGVQYISRAKNLATALVDYEVAYVNINGGSINDAVEIFSRINSKGSDMSPMWMLSALTYEESGGGFKFSDEVDQLKSGLKKFNFENIKTEIVLQCIESSTGKIYFDVKTETLAKREDFKELCIQSLQNVYNAVEFLFEEVHVTSPKLLPYNLQLIFITEFFRLTKTPTSDQLSSLKKWFWQTTYSSYFSIYSLSKQRRAFTHFQDWCLGEKETILFKAKENDVFEAVSFPSKINFGSVRSKALALFLIKTVLEKSHRSSNECVLRDFQSLSKGKNNVALAVPIFEGMDFGDYRSNRGDYSFLLGEVDGFDHSLNFINEEVRNAQDEDDMLIIRRKLIAVAEMEFVQSIDIQYSWEYWMYEDSDDQPF